MMPIENITKITRGGGPPPPYPSSWDDDPEHDITEMTEDERRVLDTLHAAQSIYPGPRSTEHITYTAAGQFQPSMRRRHALAAALDGLVAQGAVVRLDDGQVTLPEGVTPRAADPDPTVYAPSPARSRDKPGQGHPDPSATVSGLQDGHHEAADHQNNPYNSDRRNPR